MLLQMGNLIVVLLPLSSSALTSHHDFNDIKSICYRPKTACSAIPGCLNCTLPQPSDCPFHGPHVIANCSLPKGVMCEAPSRRAIRVAFPCRFCWQLPPSQIDCEPLTNCSATAPGELRLVETRCEAVREVLCFGNRVFKKRVECNWTNGYKWSTALILSITLGGFGADRFYLGLWREGIGKIFSFGGLGVWTLVDVILIATGYIGPADGSLYM